MINQHLFIAFSNLAFGIILVLLCLKIKRIGGLLALRQAKRQLQTNSMRGLWQSIKRMWQKDDLVPYGISRFSFRLFPLIQLCFWVCMVMILGRDGSGKLNGNLISLIAVLLTSSVVHYYHVWMLNRKGLILINFRSLELNLIADFYTIISLGIMIFKYKTIDLWLIESAQIEITHWGIITMPFASLLFVLATIYKFSQVPFTRQANPMHSYNTLSDCYSGMSNMIVKLIPNLYYIVSLMIITLLWFGGGNNQGYTPIYFSPQLAPYTGHAVIMIKVMVLCLVHQLIFASLPSMTQERSRSWVVRGGIMFITLQVIIATILYLRGY